MKKEEKANVVYFGSRERGDGRREHQSFRGHGPGVAGGRRQCHQHQHHCLNNTIIIGVQQ